MPTIKIHNVETGEVVERDMNDDELAQWETDQIKAEAEKVQAEAKATQKAAAEAKLAALGLTTEDLQALGL